MQFLPGAQLGPYEILSALGAGGMGEVYRARDTRLDREVAVKVLPEHLSANPEIRARFEREARAVSSLNHPHICTLFDVGRDGNTDYLVMELVEGESLADRLARGPLAFPEVLRLGVQICGALTRAHRSGIIHRDLKPGNIMLSKGGAKLMDFGLARNAIRTEAGEGSASRLAQSPTIAQPLTAEGSLVGTFQYMAPEQLEGKETDERSDVWALGCVLYEMATGSRAFEGSSQASLIASIMGQPVRALKELAPASPPALDRLIQACLAKDPEERVQTAHDVGLQLQWLQSEGESGTQPGAASTVAARRGPRWALWAAVVLVVLAASTTAFVLGRQDRPSREATEVQYHRKTYRKQAIFTARFMPDGKTIVLSSALEGNRTQLYIIRPEYPAPQPLGPENVHLLAISSRGELAVLVNASYSGHHRLFSGTLARMPIEGAAPREVLEGVREADWSPDGTQLAIIHEVDGKDRLEYPVGKVLYESAGYLSDLRVSRDGERVAFMEHPGRWDDRGSVKLVDREGHARELSSGYWGMEGLAWSQDGAAVFFSATTNGSDFSVYRVGLRGDAKLVRQSAGLLTIHDIAANGTWLATRDDYPFRIMFKGASDEQASDISWLDGSVAPRLSADAKSVVFCDQAEDGGPNYGVTLRSAEGGAIVRLGEGIAQQFSKDGKSVLAVVPSTPPRIMRYPVGAGQPVRLDHGEFENIGQAQWMPGEDEMLVSGNQMGQPPRCF
ncbi:MAG TPA: protein kinase, partial [Thermoanaerobaculia bacterium]|nr:protein kinase [Thermoanaerobaculia bacterium]